jgi:predicted RNA-binding protein YlqC (UPF0109 family)
MDSTTPETLPGEAFLRYVLESIVDDKESLVIESKIDELGVLLTVQVSDDDMGKLIGKGGQTVKALRTLLRLLGSVGSQRINLKILEPPAEAAAA